MWYTNTVYTAMRDWLKLWAQGGINSTIVLLMPQIRQYLFVLYTSLINF